MRRALTLTFGCLVACSSPQATDCIALASDAQAAVDGRYAFYQQGCGSDLDCALVPSELSCFKGCPNAVLAASMMDAMNNLAGRDGDICHGSSCVVTLGCDPVHAACVAGACQTAEGAADAGSSDAGEELPDAGPTDGGP